MLPAALLERKAQRGEVPVEGAALGRVPALLRVQLLPGLSDAPQWQVEKRQWRVGFAAGFAGRGLQAVVDGEEILVRPVMPLAVEVADGDALLYGWQLLKNE